MGLFRKLFSKSRKQAPSPSTKTKTIRLPGATIKIPDHYATTTDDDGTTIIEAVPHALPCIRVSLLWVKAKENASPPDMTVVIHKDAAKRSLPVEELPGGETLFTYDQKIEERGYPLVIRYWQLGIANCMAIFSITIDANAVDAPQTRAALADMPEILHSFERHERTEFIETPTRTYQSTITTVDPPQKSEHCPLTPQEKTQLARNLASIDQFVPRYAAPTTDLTPALLDTIFTRWLHDNAPDKPDNETAALAIGSCFGQCLCRLLNFQWEVITDDYGTAWAVSQPQTTLNAFPIESVRKRIESRQFDFMEAIHQILKSQIEKGDYDRR